MSIRITYHRLTLAVIFGLLIPAMACNFPFRAPGSGSNSGLQQTLTVLASTTQVDQTPMPEIGEEQASPPTGEFPPRTPPAFGTPFPPIPGMGNDGPLFTYFTQSGDTLTAVAKRFGVDPEQIASSDPIPFEQLLPPGQELLIPDQMGDIEYFEPLLPDSEIIYSPSTKDFHIQEFVNSAGGYLSTYGETVKGKWLSGTEIVQKVAQENSINPRLLLALLEFRSGWVLGQPTDPSTISHPIGFYVPDFKGLYYELVLTATHLGVGYYGWRSGALTRLTFPDGSTARVSPGLNPGTVALQAFLSKLNNQDEWRESLYSSEGFVSLYQRMYGDPWKRAALVEPVIPAGLEQPIFELPFGPGERWSFTGGPHLSWNSGSSQGALDFSPVTGEPACTTSKAWVTASATGRVTRAADNVVAIDLDGDGHEGTGWVLVYLHIVDQDIISPGTWVEVNQPLGHPSCERGKSTGTHVHIARKYNGEWISADGSIAYILSGWEVRMGEKSYQGALIKGDQTVTANPGGPSSSLIIRDE
jgi:murein DD-endopeptidase MepM/ murein hydrolase activator NlpD